MVIRIQDELRRLNDLGLLEGLLADKTTGGNILWGTDAYSELGPAYGQEQEMRAELITGERAGLLKNRAAKAQEQQSERTRQLGEVFTPRWVCAKMNDYLDGEWSGGGEKSWQRYVDSRRMELTCGEAPFLVSRYDVTSGEIVPLEERIGVLDRKLRAVGENTETEEAWLKWALRALQACFGYEFQGDSLLLSRLNLLAAFEDYLSARWNRKPTAAEYAAVTDIVTWNLWQMDGLTKAVPFSKTEENTDQLSLFDWPGGSDPPEPKLRTQCVIYDWRNKKEVVFADLPARGSQGMKFDFIIGNPPYQDETLGDNKGFAPPIYDKYIDEAYKVSDCVELIHPARFLFNAGSTPKAWNQKMLADPHLKILFHEQNSAKVFPNTDIKGGVAITYHDAKKNYGAIETYTSFDELNEILKKVYHRKNFSSFKKIVVSSYSYHFTQALHKDFPTAEKRLSKGHAFDLKSNVLEKLPDIFTVEKPADNHDYILIFGRIENERAYRYIRAEYVNKVSNLYKWKIFVPKANGSGALGEVLTTPVIGQPVIGQPVIGHTESFISIGCFNTENEAQACYKYICTKFARCMLGILKVTQDNPPEKWKYVPLQDFTPSSDIDWTKSIPEIDRQLYAKYGLDEAEIAFIESHVKEMS